jgi:hypothetical protein
MAAEKTTATTTIKTEGFTTTEAKRNPSKGLMKTKSIFICIKSKIYNTKLP